MERILAIIVILVALALIGLSLFGPKPHNTGSATFQKEAQITLTKYAINPNRISILAGRVKLVITNNDDILHKIEIYDPVEKRVIGGIDLISPRSTETIWVDLIRGRRYEIYDPDWREKGMDGVIIPR